MADKHRNRKYKTYTPQELKTWISALINQNKLYLFYISHAWLHIREEVLCEQHHECQHCKAKGLFTPATMAHHIKTVRDRPDLALTKSNLMALCDSCHWEVHHPHDKKKSKWDDERW